MTQLIQGAPRAHVSGPRTRRIFLKNLLFMENGASLSKLKARGHVPQNENLANRLIVE